MTESGISIVVPTRNSGNHIGTLLRSIASQTQSPLETLVVDGDSRDQTAILSRHLGATVVPYPCDGDMRGFARNLGARRASGTHLFFLDSDMELTLGVIAELTTLLEGGVDAVIIPEETHGIGLLGRIRAWEREVVQSTDYLTVARLINRTTFAKVGGFNESTIGFEDLDFQACLIESGARLLRSSCPIIHHEEDSDVFAYLRKRRHYQATSQIYRERHPGLSAKVFSPGHRLRLYKSGLRSPTDVIPFVGALTLRGLELL
jgi:glycosyltransferase involved in cell wall biosynthesis